MSGYVKIARRFCASSWRGAGPLPVSLVSAAAERQLRRRRPVLVRRPRRTRCAVRDGENGRQPSSPKYRPAANTPQRSPWPPRPKSSSRRPNDPPSRWTSAPGSENPVFVSSDSAPPSVFSPIERVRSGHQVRGADRLGRDQVPAQRVAERFVQPDAVDVDRHPLRRAQQRRREEAAVLKVGLQRVLLDLVAADAPERVEHVVREIQAVTRGDRVGGHRLDVRRHVIARQPRAVERRRRGHDRLARGVDGLDGGRVAGRRRRNGRRCGGRRARNNIREHQRDQGREAHRHKLYHLPR